MSEARQALVSVNADQSCVPTTSSNQQQKAAFMFVGLHKNNVDAAVTKLGDLYQAQCSIVAFSREELQDLTQEDMSNLSQLVEILGLYMQKDQSGLGSLTVSGLKEGVNQVVQIVHTITLLRREVRAKEEEHLYGRVTWCILGESGEWERLPKRANHKLETCDAPVIVDAKSNQWRVDPQKMEATREATRQTAKLKRLENPPGEDMVLDEFSQTLGDDIHT